MLQAFAVLMLNVVFVPYLLAAAIPIVLLFLFIRHYYLKTAREVKRIEAMSKLRLVFFRAKPMYIERGWMFTIFENNVWQW